MKRRAAKPPMLAKIDSQKDPNQWQEVGLGFEFKPNPAVLARLEPAAGKWAMRVTVNGRRYVGQRDTLETAFKAADRLLYEQAKDTWLKSLCGAVLAPWVGTLEEL